MMKSASKTILALAFAVIVFDRGFSLLAHQILERSPNRFAQVYFDNLSADILVLGNSRADRHFDSGWASEHLNARLLNLGIGGNHMRLNYILLEDYLLRHKPPRNVIVELSSVVVEPNNMGDFMMFYKQSPGLSKHMRDHEPELFYAGKIFHALQFNNDMFLRVAKDLVVQKPNRYLNGVLTEAAAEKYATNIIAHDENIESIHNIRDLSQRYGFDLIFVITPLGVGEEKLQGFSSLMVALQEATLPCELLSYAFMFDDRELFNDPQHMNKRGAERWQEEFFEHFEKRRSGEDQCAGSALG